MRLGRQHQVAQAGLGCRVMGEQQTAVRALLRRPGAAQHLESMAGQEWKAEVQGARDAVATLALALPRHAAELGAEVPSDFLDLSVDLAFDVDVDVLSAFNIGCLADAESECAQAGERVRALSNKIQSKIATLAESLRAEQAASEMMVLHNLREAISFVPPEPDVD